MRLTLDERPDWLYGGCPTARDARGLTWFKWGGLWWSPWNRPVFDRQGRVVNTQHVFSANPNVIGWMQRQAVAA